MDRVKKTLQNIKKTVNGHSEQMSDHRIQSTSNFSPEDLMEEP